MASTDRSGVTMGRIRERLANKYRLAKEQAFVQFRRQNLEESLLFAQASSTFAQSNHFGVWYDDELEGLLSSIGFSLFRDLPDHPLSHGHDHRRILYVATALDVIGGHSDVLRLWLKFLSGRQNLRQYVITTLKAAPAFLAKIEGTGCISLSVRGDTLADRIKSLVHQCLEVMPDYIFLFAHPDDVVAIAAVSFLKARLGARVIFYDHGDYAFWLGKNVTDVLVDFDPSRAYVSRKLRNYGGRLMVIPLTTDLAESSVSKHERRGARESTSSLSVGSPWKIVSDDCWNYFGAIKAVLENNPTHAHILLTTPSEAITKSLRGWPDSVLRRFVVKYNVSSPASYYGQADFLIETFPVTGGLVRAEAMAFGLPVIFIRNSRFSLMLSHSGIDSISGSYPFIACSNDDVVSHAGVLIKSFDLRRRYGSFLGALFLRDFSPEAVLSKLEPLLHADYGSDGLESFSEMAGRVRVDSDYLLAGDLARGSLPSPYVRVVGILLKNGRFRFRLLFDCLKHLKIEDWLWCVKAVARHLRRRVSG